MAKVKLDLNTEDIIALNDPKRRPNKIEEIHGALTTCIEDFDVNVKASITVDTDKE